MTPIFFSFKYCDKGAGGEAFTQAALAVPCRSCILESAAATLDCIWYSSCSWLHSVWQLLLTALILTSALDCTPSDSCSWLHFQWQLFLTAFSVAAALVCIRYGSCFWLHSLFQLLLTAFIVAAALVCIRYGSCSWLHSLFQLLLTAFSVAAALVCIRYGSCSWLHSLFQLLLTAFIVAAAFDYIWCDNCSCLFLFLCSFLNSCRCSMTKSMTPLLKTFFHPLHGTDHGSHPSLTTHDRELVSVLVKSSVPALIPAAALHCTSCDSCSRLHSMWQLLLTIQCGSCSCLH